MEIDQHLLLHDVEGIATGDDVDILALIIVLGCLSGVLLIVLICLLVYFCYVVYRDKKIARREAAYIEEDSVVHSRDDYVDLDDPVYEHIRTVVETERETNDDENNGQIHSNGHVTVDVEKEVGDADDEGEISFDPAFRTEEQQNSRVVIQDNGLYSSIDRDDGEMETPNIEARRSPDFTATAPAETPVSVYEDIESVRRHPSRNNSSENDDISTDGSESTCTNEQGEPIYSKPDMSKKFNRHSTIAETDASVSLSQSTDSAIAECDETPPSLPKKSDDLME